MGIDAANFNTYLWYYLIIHKQTEKTLIRQLFQDLVWVWSVYKIVKRHLYTIFYFLNMIEVHVTM